MAYLGRTSNEIPTKGRGKKLSGKMLRFVEEYTNGHSEGFMRGSEAVRLAGYKVKSTNANRLAVELLNHPLVKKEVQERMDKRQEKMELTAEFVLSKLIDLVATTPKDGDRIRALELLGKNLALWRERTEISGPDGDAIAMEQKVREDVADFTRAIARLAERNRKEGMAGVTDGRREGSA